MRQVALLSLSIFVSNTPLLAEDGTPRVEFDQGVNSSAILNPTRQAGPLSRLPHLLDELHSIELDSQGGKGVYPDLRPLILNSMPYRNAELVRADPRYRAIDPPILQRLEGEWAQISSVRSDLLSRASAWEGRNEQLAAEGRQLEQRRTSLETRRRDLNAEIDDYNQQCTTHPLPPDEYQRCVNWQNSLIRRRDQLLRDIADFNRDVERWNSRSSEIHRERTSMVDLIKAWEQRIADWLAAVREALEEDCKYLNGTSEIISIDPIRSKITCNWDCCGKPYQTFEFILGKPTQEEIDSLCRRQRVRCRRALACDP